MSVDPSTICMLLGLALVGIYLWMSKSVSAPTPKAAVSLEPLQVDEEEDDVEMHPMTILYGTQAGKARNFAEDLASEARKYRFSAKLIDLEDYDPEQFLREDYVVLLLATYGEGDPTDAAMEFMEWIEQDDRELEEGWEKIRFSVFGLGNKQYEFYNKQGKVMDRRLYDLGCRRVHKLGLGDDDESIEDDWSVYKETFWVDLMSFFGKSIDTVNDKAREFEPSYRIVFHGNTTATSPAAHLHSHARKVSIEHTIHVPHASTQVEEVAVVASRELRNKTFDHDEYASTRHIELDLSNTSLSYTTADNLGIYPANTMRNVGRLVKLLAIDKPLSQLFSLARLNPALSPSTKNFFREPITIQQALQCVLDLSAVPRKKTLKILRQYASDSKEADLLLRLSDDHAMYATVVVGNRLGMVDILDLCGSVRPPLEHLLEFAPKIQPRYFTIASSSKQHPRQVHITLAAICEQTPGLIAASKLLQPYITVPKTRKSRLWGGICSQFMLDCEKGNRIPVFVRESSFRLPDDPATPVIMIGPGTGIAPMRAFLQEGYALLQQHELRQLPWRLFVGCRHSNVDYLYQDEIEQAQRDGVVQHVYTAFSRDQETKVYVQHRIREVGQEMLDLLEDNGAYVFVCGASAMGRDVRETFCDLFQRRGLSLAASQEKLHQLQHVGRYVQELWG